METWITENYTFATILGLAFFAILTAAALFLTRRTARSFRQKSVGMAAFAGAVVLLFGSIVGLLLFGLATFGIGSFDAVRLNNRAAPELIFENLRGESPTSIGELNGKVVLVNLWATWCPPCREEMPALDRLQQTYADRGLVVLQISDEARAIVDRYLATSPMSTIHGVVEEIPWPHMARPTTFLVDREGVIRNVIVGGRSFEQFEEEVLRLL